MAEQRRKFGKLRKLQSGRWQASYIGPDQQRHVAPITFHDRDAGAFWLRAEERLRDEPTWTPPAQRRAEALATKQTLKDYAADWLKHRRTRNGPIKDRTRAHYQKLLDDRILPTFGELPLDAITVQAVNAWHERMVKQNTPTMTAHAYSLMHAIMATASKPQGADKPLIAFNPCQIDGGQHSRTKHRAKPATPEQLEAMIGAMPERHRLAIALMGWCGLRFGETIALERRDFDLTTKRVTISKGVVLVDRVRKLDTPKDHEVREVTYPPHLEPMIRQHLENFTEPGPRGRLFTGKTNDYLSQSTLNGKPSRRRRIKGRMVNESASGFRAACEAAGCPDFRLHDLRHTNLTWTAQFGSFADVMQRAGHSTQKAALRYVHAAEERDVDIARHLSELVTKPTSQPTKAATPAALFEAMTDEQLATVVAGLSPEQLAELVPQLKPETLVRVLVANR